jgi:hypothetical protein
MSRGYILCINKRCIHQLGAAAAHRSSTASRRSAGSGRGARRPRPSPAVQHAATAPPQILRSSHPPQQQQLLRGCRSSRSPAATCAAAPRSPRRPPTSATNEGLGFKASAAWGRGRLHSRRGADAARQPVRSKALGWRLRRRTVRVWDACTPGGVHMPQSPGSLRIPPRRQLQSSMPTWARACLRLGVYLLLPSEHCVYCIALHQPELFN